MAARLVVSAASLLALITLAVGQARACEKHLHGHQNSSDAQGEVQGR